MTEPNTGLNTLKLKTRAVREGDHYVVNGQKIWISTAQVANKILLLARTTPIEEVTAPGEGLSLFYTDLDRSRDRGARDREAWAARRSIPTSSSSTTCAIPVEDRIGEEGKGFSYILHGMNPERILLAAEATGLGRAALRRAASYAKRAHRLRPADRQEPGRSSIRWPNAGWSSRPRTCMCQQAAWLYDQGRPCGAEANAAKFLGAEAGFRACETAVLTHGGMGYAKEYHVERYLREAMLPRIAPV